MQIQIPFKKLEVRHILLQKSKKNGKDFTPKDSMELFQFTKNAREFKEECEKFAKIGEHVTKIVYGNKGQGRHGRNDSR